MGKNDKSFDREQYSVFISKRPDVPQVKARIGSLEEELVDLKSRLLKLNNLTRKRLDNAKAHPLATDLNDNLNLISQNVTQSLIDDGVIKDPNSRYAWRLEGLLETLIAYLVEKSAGAVYLSKKPRGFDAHHFIAGLVYFRKEFVDEKHAEAKREVNAFIDTVRDHYTKEGWLPPEDNGQS